MSQITTSRTVTKADGAAVTATVVFGVSELTVEVTASSQNGTTFADVLQAAAQQIDSDVLVVKGKNVLVEGADGRVFRLRPGSEPVLVSDLTTEAFEEGDTAYVDRAGTNG